MRFFKVFGAGLLIMIPALIVLNLMGASDSAKAVFAFGVGVGAALAFKIIDKRKAR